MAHHVSASSKTPKGRPLQKTSPSEHLTQRLILRIAPSDYIRVPPRVHQTTMV